MTVTNVIHLVSEQLLLSINQHYRVKAFLKLFSETFLSPPNNLVEINWEIAAWLNRFIQFRELKELS